MTIRSIKTLFAAISLGAIFMAALPAPAIAGDARKVLDKVKSELKTTASVQFDSHNRLSIRWTRGMVQAGEISSQSAALLAKLRPILWKGRDFRILETRKEGSRFGTIAWSTISLDGIPVIDQYMKVATAGDGSLRDVVISMPAEATGFGVMDGEPSVSLARAGTTICQHAAQRFDGLVCPDQAQRVWFMNEDGVLAPGARMLLKGAEMSRLFEAIVDLRTGKIVRFVDIARR